MEVKWLRQVFIESGAEAVFDFLRVFMTCESDGFLPGLALFCFDHQIEPAPIGQTNVADEGIEVQMVEQKQRVPDVTCIRNLMATMSEQIGKDQPALVVIFHQQDVHNG